MSYYNNDNSNHNNNYYPPPPPPPPQHQQYGDGGGYYQPPPPQHQQYQPQQPFYQPPPVNNDNYYPPPPPPPQQQHQDFGAFDGDFKGAKQYNRTPKFRDLWAALLFLAHFALFVVMAVLFIKALPSTAFKNSGQLKHSKDFYSLPTMIMWLCVLLASIVFSVLYLMVMQMFAGQMLVISFWFSVLVMIGTGCYYLAAKIWFAGAIMDTWTLIKDRGVDAVINDSLIGNVLQMGSFLCAAVVALIAWLYITITKPEYNNTGSYTAPIILSAFIIAMSMFTVLLKCIDSGAATTFVCLAEDPEAMQRNNPELYHMVREAYPNVVHGVRDNNNNAY
ncbi:putative choline transporter, neither null mutation nor overexpression affects choline transport [Coemansia furcata]|nr:putative choline transporter, neither null mutation nor overexpression affects choline transport [Coemansia furcata]